MKNILQYLPMVLLGLCGYCLGRSEEILKRPWLCCKEAPPKFSKLLETWKSKTPETNSRMQMPGTNNSPQQNHNTWHQRVHCHSNLNQSYFWVTGRNCFFGNGFSFLLLSWISLWTTQADTGRALPTRRVSPGGHTSPAFTIFHSHHLCHWLTVPR